VGEQCRPLRHASLTFSAAQSFKEGATVSCNNGEKFTIDTGAGTDWTALQAATATASGQSFSTSDPGAGRGRGSSGVIVPGAPHFVYVSSVDASGNADWYFYVDTLFPENGVHPYTRDSYAPPPWAAAKSATALALIPDIPTRVRMLEGLLRGSQGDIGNPDKRLDSIETRLTNIEAWIDSRVQQLWDPGNEAWYWLWVAPGSWPSDPRPLVAAPDGNQGPYTVTQLLSQGDGAPA
jgi:hypothetical protein